MDKNLKKFLTKEFGFYITPLSHRINQLDRDKVLLLSKHFDIKRLFQPNKKITSEINTKILNFLCDCLSFCFIPASSYFIYNSNIYNAQNQMFEDLNQVLTKWKNSNIKKAVYFVQPCFTPENNLFYLIRYCDLK